MDAPINPLDPFTFGRGASDSPHDGGAPPGGNSPDRSHSSRLSGDGSGRSNDPFDALADLFLGPARAPEATSPPPLRLVSHGTSRAADAAHDPGRAGQTPGLDRLVEPKADQVTSADSRSNPAEPTKVEGMVLGHLPVFASAWATQYAKHAAQVTGETVALLRFTSGRASLDVYGAGASGERCSDLKTAIHTAALASPRWMVRLPDACEPELAEGDIDVLTLLSGADEAAVVSCYRTLKSLSGVDRSPEAGPMSWRVAIMGSDPIKATDAARRVERAASAFLESELEIAPCVARIGSLRSALLFDGVTDVSWRDAIEIVRQSANTPRPPLPPTEPSTDRSGGRSSSAPGSGVAPASPRVELRPIASDPGSVVPRQAARDHPGAARAGPQTKPAPGSDPAPWPTSLHRSAVQCPHAPAVEFGIDAEGMVHLLVRDGAEASIRSLITAAAWATSHASLLSMADPRIIGCDAPVLHLVTTAPSAERRLLDTPVRVHALARVGDSWAMLDLN
jgi:hypothetical protein